MRNTVAKILKNDFKSFSCKSFNTLHCGQPLLNNWHLDLISEYLTSVANGKMKRLIINIPPRSLKSVCISVAWPAWLLARNPAYKIISASYSQALSVKHGLDCKKIILSEWYKDFFPKTQIASGQNTKNKFVTTHNGLRLSTSIGGTLTGEGADFLIVDDPLTPMQALSNAFRGLANTWFEQTFTSRLNDQKSGAIIIVMQRLHVKDLTGFLLEKDAENWHLLNLPLVAEKDENIIYESFSHHRKIGQYLHEDRNGEKEVENLKKALGSYAFAAQYQQNPVQLDGGIIKNSWLKYYEQSPHFEAIYQSWDCAIKTNKTSDYSVCTTWGIHNSNYYLIDVLRSRLDYPALKKAMIDHAALFNLNAVIIEDKASGQQLIQEVVNSGINIVKYLPKFDKTTRLILQSNAFEAGRVYLPKNHHCLIDLIPEILAFPNVEHDDQVDSVSQFLEWAESKQKNFDYGVRRL